MGHAVSQRNRLEVAPNFASSYPHNLIRWICYRPRAGRNADFFFLRGQDPFCNVRKIAECKLIAALDLSDKACCDPRGEVRFSSAASSRNHLGYRHCCPRYCSGHFSSSCLHSAHRYPASAGRCSRLGGCPQGWEEC